MKRGFVTPTVAELASYAREIGYQGFNAQAFLDHYEMVGWVVGKARTPMVSWRAAVRTWQRRQAEWAGAPLAQEEDPALMDYAAQVRARLAALVVLLPVPLPAQWSWLAPSRAARSAGRQWRHR